MSWPDYTKHSEYLPCRLGVACTALFEYSAAAQALARGVRLDPGNRDMAAKLQEAEGRAEYEAACKHVHVSLQRRDLVLKLRGVSYTTPEHCACAYSHACQGQIVINAMSHIQSWHPRQPACLCEAGAAQRGAGRHGAAVQAEHDRARLGHGGLPLVSNLAPGWGLHGCCSA